MRAWLSRLFSAPQRTAPLYDKVMAEARAEHWFTIGEVADSIDGRFAVLATLLALVSVRLERGSVAAQRGGIELTERFIADMDGEIRQLGIGDPTIGKQVGAMVGALGGRVGAWRRAIAGDEQWSAVLVRSLYRGHPPGEAAAAHSMAATHGLWDRLTKSDDDALIAGAIG